MQTLQRRDVRFTTPIFSLQETAGIVQTASSTLNRWVHGYSFKQRDGKGVGHTPPLVRGVATGRGATVSFDAFAETYVIEAFRRTGLPMARIRPAVDAIRAQFGLEEALLSERLKTDGAEVLFETEDRGGRLVVARNGQGVFNEVVAEFLQGIDYDAGWADHIRLPQFRQTAVVVDPSRNSGQPTVARVGVTVEDIVSRARAGEPMADLADDFALDIEDIRSLVLVGSGLP